MIKTKCGIPKKGKTALPTKMRKRVTVCDLYGQVAIMEKELTAKGYNVKVTKMCGDTFRVMFVFVNPSFASYRACYTRSSWTLRGGLEKMLATVENIERNEKYYKFQTDEEPERVKV